MQHVLNADGSLENFRMFVSILVENSGLQQCFCHGTTRHTCERAIASLVTCGNAYQYDRRDTDIYERPSSVHRIYRYH